MLGAPSNLSTGTKTLPEKLPQGQDPGVVGTTVVLPGIPVPVTVIPKGVVGTEVVVTGTVVVVPVVDGVDPGGTVVEPAVVVAAGGGVVEARGVVPGDRVVAGRVVPGGEQFPFLTKSLSSNRSWPKRQEQLFCGMLGRLQGGGGAVTTRMTPRRLGITIFANMI